MEKVVVGLSGGVDSSVAAYLLKKQGYDVVGVTMQMWQDKIDETIVGDAAEVAESLEIPHYVCDFREEFKRDVIDYFTNEYICGRTPNPCVVCNRKVKWEALLKKCDEIGASYIATGHYARIDTLPNGRLCVRNSVTANKDQTYALYNLTQEQLKRTLMPVGDYTKEEIRQIAQLAGIKVANKKDSQEICFVTDNDYASFIEKYSKDYRPQDGNFVDSNGKVLGRHKGIIHYTYGQRKGLEISLGKRMFVTDIRPATNEVVLGDNEDLFTQTVICDKLNYMGIKSLDGPMRVKTKIRYNHGGEYCTIEKLDNERVKCSFEKPVRAATPGQAAVFYDGEYCIGGGIIIK